MRVLFARLAKIWICRIFVNKKDEDISATECQHVIVEAIPLSAHHWEVVLQFLLVDYDVLMIGLKVCKRGS